MRDILTGGVGQRLSKLKELRDCILLKLAIDDDESSAELVLNSPYYATACLLSGQTNSLGFSNILNSTYEKIIEAKHANEIKSSFLNLDFLKSERGEFAVIATRTTNEQQVITLFSSRLDDIIQYIKTNPAPQ